MLSSSDLLIFLPFGIKPLKPFVPRETGFFMVQQVGEVLRQMKSSDKDASKIDNLVKSLVEVSFFSHGLFFLGSTIAK